MRSTTSGKLNFCGNNGKQSINYTPSKNSDFRYTNTCVMVKGNNPFVVSSNNLQPPFLKNKYFFNEKYINSFYLNNTK